MTKSLILSLDQGTTSSRAILFDQTCRIRGIANRGFKQIFPRAGWAEQDPSDIWTTQLQSARALVAKCSRKIMALAIANQRETTIVWDRHTGKPIHNAISWQCRRTAQIVDELKKQGLESHIRRTTGLIPDPYFSGPKIKWVLDNVRKAKIKAKRGDLLFGTVDTYLTWKLTDGAVHTTDFSNASRTMLFDINRGHWDDGLLDVLDIPADMLPEVKPSNETIGYTDKRILKIEIPICTVLGDQQAALFGQTCFDRGAVKNTYGTGCFILSNIGETPSGSPPGLLSTIAWAIGRKITYALEGSVFTGGAVVKWLRDGVGIIKKSSETEQMARKVTDSEGVYFVPAFSGLGAPSWDMYARGIIIGITSGTNRAHIIRAALEAICFQTADVLDVMSKVGRLQMKGLRVDGGATRNDYLMQLQADLLGLRVERPRIIETTALGVAFLAGLTVGFWQNLEELSQLRSIDKVFEPDMPEEKRLRIRRDWQRAIPRARNWSSQS